MTTDTFSKKVLRRSVQSLQGVWELELYSKMEDGRSDDGIGSKSECSLLLLADELIDMVLSYSIIDHKDLWHCSQVCRRLNIIATGNELWKKKALSRYVYETSPKT